MIRINNLGFAYNKGKNKQIDNISLELKKDYFTCLYGHNGAGKTTLMNLIYGSLVPGVGSVEYDSKMLGNSKGDSGASGSENYKKVSLENLYDYRQDVAMVSAETMMDYAMSVADMLEMTAILYEKYDSDYFKEVLDRLDLGEDKLNNCFDELSKGEKMKVNIAFAMARHPKYLILDEPFANMDPVVKIEIARLLQESVLAGKMGVFVSTHLMDEIADMVDYVAVIENGKLVEFGDRDETTEWR